MIDLHLHTDASDGAFSLQELVRKAEAAGLSAIAITDHDTVKSAKQIKKLKAEIEVIPGIEISVYDDKRDYIDIHVLGLFIDPQDARLLKTLDRLKKEREDQKQAIVEKLNELGYTISYGDAKKHARGSLGRPHIAQALMEKYPDEFPTMPEVFNKLLDQGKPAYKPRKDFFCLNEAINLIHGARGLAILAHPVIYKYDLEKLLTDFKGLGGDGIESYYDYSGNYDFDKEQNQTIAKKLHSLAKRFGFLESGGSDFHNAEWGILLGKLDVPDAILMIMKEHISQQAKRIS